jgi:hypothetical protein
MRRVSLIRNARTRIDRWVAVRLRRRPAIKVHGLLRVGTNYLEALLTTNFHVVCLGPVEGGWKHGPCRYDPGKRYVFLVKNPYAWLVSFRDWETIHHRTTAQSLAEFARQPLSHIPLKAAWGVHTPIEAWTRTLTSWLSYDGRDNTVFVRYEDLINGLDAQLSRVQQRLDLRMRGATLLNIEARADTWTTPSPRKPFRVDYYRNHQYLAEFDDQTLALLRNHLDRTLLSRFNYQLY